MFNLINAFDEDTWFRQPRSVRKVFYIYWRLLTREMFQGHIHDAQALASQQTSEAAD